MLISRYLQLFVSRYCEIDDTLSNLYLTSPIEMRENLFYRSPGQGSSHKVKRYIKQVHQ